MCDMSFAGSIDTTRSLCPTLGIKNAVLHSGPCPLECVNPTGKTLTISFIGIKPFITYSPIGGSDFLVVNALAKKFGFTPKFVAERSYDTVKSNTSTHGMLFRVRTNIHIPCSPL